MTVIHVTSVETTKKFLQMSRFLLHSSIEHSFCLVVLGNNDGDKSFVKFLFLLYETLLGKNIMHLLVTVESR